MHGIDQINIVAHTDLQFTYWYCVTSHYTHIKHTRTHTHVLHYIVLAACGGAPLSASLHEAVTPGQRTWTGRCFLPQHATCMQPSVCSVSQLASRSALCKQCRFRGYLHMQCSSCGALAMQCSSRGALSMQCSSCGALAMHSLQSVHFACSAAFAGTFTCSAALSVQVP